MVRYEPLRGQSVGSWGVTGGRRRRDRVEGGGKEQLERDSSAFRERMMGIPPRARPAQSG